MLGNTSNHSIFVNDYTSFTDIANVYILPIVCLISILSNILSISVVMNMGIKKDPVNQYILISSICNLVTLILTSFTFLIRCGNLCQTSCKFSSKAYELYVHLYVSNIIIQFNILLDAIFTFNRLISFSNYKFKTKKWYMMLNKFKYVPMLILSALTNVPIYLIVRDIVSSVDNSCCFKIITNATGKSSAMKGFLFVLALFRGALILILIFCMNIIIQYKFTSFIIKKNKIMTISAIVLKPSIYTIKRYHKPLLPFKYHSFYSKSV